MDAEGDDAWDEDQDGSDDGSDSSDSDSDIEITDEINGKDIPEQLVENKESKAVCPTSSGSDPPVVSQPPGPAAHSAAASVPKGHMVLVTCHCKYHVDPLGTMCNHACKRQACHIKSSKPKIQRPR